jgi:hypothetical protein
MEATLELPADPPAMALPSGGEREKRKRRRKPQHPQLLVRAQLDGRTSAAKLFDRLVLDVENDLGGPAQLSTIEHALVEGFCGAAVMLQSLNARIAAGEQIDAGAHALAISALVRVASRLGLARRARDVTPPDPLRYESAEEA